MRSYFVHMVTYNIVSSCPDSTSAVCRCFRVFIIVLWVQCWSHWAFFSPPCVCVCFCVSSSCLPSLWLWLLTAHKRGRPQGRGSERVPEQPQLPGRLRALAGGHRCIHAFSRFASFIAACARSALVQAHSHTAAWNRRPGLILQWVEKGARVVHA